MQEWKTAICGSPLAGKSTLLNALGRTMKAGRPHQEMQEGSERIHSLRVSAAQLRRAGVEVTADHGLVFVTTAGNMFYKERVIGRVLSGADLVIYVFAALEVSPPKEFQLGYYEDYATCAEELGRQAPVVPWVYALTKADALVAEARLGDLTQVAGGSLVRCSADTGQGTKELLHLICSALGINCTISRKK
jgi:predicted GTPase